MREKEGKTDRKGETETARKEQERKETNRDRRCPWYLVPHWGGYVRCNCNLYCVFVTYFVSTTLAARLPWHLRRQRKRRVLPLEVPGRCQENSPAMEALLCAAFGVPDQQRPGRLHDSQLCFRYRPNSVVKLRTGPLHSGHLEVGLGGRAYVFVCAYLSGRLAPRLLCNIGPCTN